MSKSAKMQADLFETQTETMKYFLGVESLKERSDENEAKTKALFTLAHNACDSIE